MVRARKARRTLQGVPGRKQPSVMVNRKRAKEASKVIPGTSIKSNAPCGVIALAALALTAILASGAGLLIAHLVA